jgi:hypothetical protein
MKDLPDPKTMAPLLAAPNDTMGDNWPVAWTTGNSSDDGNDWHICTDQVRASEMAMCDFPSDSRTDALAIVAIVNAYRTGQLVPKQAK